MTKHFGNGIIWDINRVKDRHEKFIKKNYGRAIYGFSLLYHIVDSENLSVFSKIINTDQETLGILNSYVTDSGEIKHVLLDKNYHNVVG